MTRLALVLAMIATVGCRKKPRELPPDAASPTLASDASAAPAAWPAAGDPELPPPLARLPWPATVEDLRLAPGLAGDGGVIWEGYNITALTWCPDVASCTKQVRGYQLDVGSDLVASLGRSWGPGAKAAGASTPMWFNPTRHLRAHLSGSTLLLEYYVPAVQLLAGAPDRLVGNASVPLGSPVAALDRYAPWTRSRTDLTVLLWLPPSEWDPLPVSAALSIDKGVVWRIRFTVFTGGVTEAEQAVLDALHARYGTPTEVTDAGQKLLRYPGRPQVTVRHSTLDPALEVTYLR